MIGAKLWGRLRRRTTAPPVTPAFTLTEMLVVLVIIGLIAAIVGPRLFSRLDDAKQRTAHLQIVNLAAAVDLFRIDTGRIPTKDEGLDILVHAPADGSEWLGPYLAKDQVPLDPWGHPYVYQVDASGGRFTIASYGSDGKPGGAGSAKDVSSDDDSRNATKLPSDQSAPPSSATDSAIDPVPSSAPL